MPVIHITDVDSKSPQATLYARFNHILHTATKNWKYHISFVFSLGYSLAESHLIRHRCNYLSEKPGGEYDLYTNGFIDC